MLDNILRSVCDLEQKDKPNMECFNSWRGSWWKCGGSEKIGCTLLGQCIKINETFVVGSGFEEIIESQVKTINWAPESSWI